MERKLIVGDRFISKKPHPCGGSEWEVTGTGADFKLRCVKCGRILIADNDKTYRMIKGRVSGSGV